MMSKLFFVLSVFFSLPTVIAIFDLWFYVMLGRTLSPVAWNWETVSFSWVLLFPGIGCFLAAVNLDEKK